MSAPPHTPLTAFQHCPHCAAAELSVIDTRAILCRSCGFNYYFNAACAVGGLLVHQGKLIVGVRGREPQQGWLDLPGGFVEFDETAEDALVREVWEEMNVRFTDPVYLTSAPNTYRYAGIVYKTTDLFFVCTVDDIATLKAGDDVADYRLIAPEALDPQQLAFASGRIALHALLERRRRAP